MKLTSTIATVARKVLTWIGKAALAALVNTYIKYGIAGIIQQPLLAVSYLSSVGGMITAILDYATDKKFDGRIKLW